MNRGGRWLAGLSLTLVACAANETDFVASGVAVAGDWVPPATTLTRSNPQYVPVVDPPRITGSCASTCPGNVWGACTDRGCSGLLPGTLDLQRYIQNRWSYVGAGGNYSCRRNSNPASCDFLSVHSVGRAIDLMIPTTGGDADNTLGDAIANWLIENAEYIGIQRVIWDGKYWNGSRVNNHFSDISDTRCGSGYCTDHHVNHIHAELSIDAGNRRTPFFTMGPPSTTCPVVCYGNAAVRADCSFTDCAAMGQVCVPDPPRCAASEAPASVRNAAATIPAATRVGGLARYRPVAPARLFDTRTPAASTQLQRSDGAMSGPLTATRTGTFAAFPGIPADSTGVWLNVTAVPQMAPGFIAVYPAGSMTDSSSVNFTPPLARSNASAMARGASGGVTFRASTDVDVIADMTGAFAPSGMGLRTVTPTRVLDTRGSAPLAANARFTLTINGPTDARGVVANVAVIPRGAPGFVQVFPCDGAVPPTSNINHGPTAVVNNAVISNITGGQLCFQSLAEVDLIVDINGYLVDSGELSLQLINPLRVLDTRNAGSLYTGRLGAGQIVELPIATISGLPADARAALVNVTSVDASVNGFVTAFPCGMMTPNTSSLNYQTGVVTGSAVVSSLGTGRLCMYSLGRTHLIADLLGVWVPTPGSSPTDGPMPPPDVPEDPGMTDPDAGTSGDASAPELDASAPPSDGAAPGADARADASPDARASVPPAVAGCGCRTVSTTSSTRAPMSAALIALALAAANRKRRAR